MSNVLGRMGPRSSCMVASAAKVVEQANLMDLDGSAWRAVKYGEVETIVKLFPGHANVYARGPMGENVFHIAMILNNPASRAIAKYLVKVYGKHLVNCPIQARSYPSDPPGAYEGETALHIAIVNRDLDLVKFLVLNGADIRSRAWGPSFHQGGDMYYGEFPLSFGACTGQKEVVSYLMRTGARVNSDQDVKSGSASLRLKGPWWGMTLCPILRRPELVVVLSWTQQPGQRDISRDLRGPLPGSEGSPCTWMSPPGVPPPSGNTALHMCVYHTQRDIYDYLVDTWGALEGVSNHKGLTPMVLAADLSNVVMFQHIYGRRRRPFYNFGCLTSYSLALNEIDTLQERGRYIPNVVETSVRRSHLPMVQEPLVLTILEHKWQTFAGWQFAAHLVLYIVYVLSQTFLIWLISDKHEWDGRHRAVQEYIGFGLGTVMLSIEVKDILSFTNDNYHRRRCMTVPKKYEPPLYQTPGDTPAEGHQRLNLLQRLSLSLWGLDSAKSKDQVQSPEGTCSGGQAKGHTSSAPQLGPGSTELPFHEDDFAGVEPAQPSCRGPLPTFGRMWDEAEHLNPQCPKVDAPVSGKSGDVGNKPQGLLDLEGTGSSPYPSPGHTNSFEIDMALHRPPYAVPEISPAGTAAAGTPSPMEQAALRQKLGARRGSGEDLPHNIRALSQRKRTLNERLTVDLTDGKKDDDPEAPSTDTANEAASHLSRFRAFQVSLRQGVVRILDDPWLLIWHLHLGLTFVHFLTWESSYHPYPSFGVLQFDDVVVSLMGLTGWLAVVYFFRGWRVTGRLAITLERCMVAVAKWFCLYVLWNIGFTLGFYTLHKGATYVLGLGQEKEESPFRNIGYGMASLVMFTYGTADQELFCNLGGNMTPVEVFCNLYFVMYLMSVYLLLANLLLSLILTAVKESKAISESRWRHRWGIYILKAERRLPQFLRQRYRLGRHTQGPAGSSETYSHVFEVFDENKNDLQGHHDQERLVEQLELLLDGMKQRGHTLQKNLPR